MVIIDLDNCISNDEWRRSAILTDEKDMVVKYHRYQMLAAFDEAHNLDLIKPGVEVAILTSRPIFYKPITEEWLRRLEISPTIILMRDHGDLSSEPDLKRKQLIHLQKLCKESKRQGRGKKTINKAYDDRPDVVKMYRKKGIRAEVRAINARSENA